MSLAKRMLEEGGWSDIRSTSPTPYGRVNFNLFFDRQEVISRMDKKERRVLSSTGAYGRGAMRKELRSGGKRGKRSEPGQPPRYHHRGFASLKDGIFFQADLDRGSVVIGPSRVITKTIPKGGLASGAQLLEEGGPAKVLIYKHRSEPRQGRYVWVDMYMQPRPFVYNNFEKTHAYMLEKMKKVRL